MSTNNECLIVEHERGMWYYVLEHYHAPKNAWDWREYADAYGPFASKESAADNLRRNHANPGGYDVQEFSGNSDEVINKLVQNAFKPQSDGSVQRGGVTMWGPFVMFDMDHLK